MALACPFAWPALCFAPALSPFLALSTALWAVSAVCSAFLVALAASSSALSAPSRTFSSSGTLQAPVAVPLASFEVLVADCAAPVALSAADFAPSAASPVPGRCGSPRNSSWLRAICCFAWSSAASARLTASSACAVSFSASTSMARSCSFTVLRAVSYALFPSSYAPFSCSNAFSMCSRISGMRETRSLIDARCFCASSNAAFASPYAACTWSTAPRACDMNTSALLPMATWLFLIASCSGACIFAPASCSCLY